MGLDQAVFRRKNSRAKWERVWDGRKENHIHQFMEGEVGTVVNCGYLPLTREHIEQLVDRLRRVDADHELAGAVLPTQEGFFFGTTDYDEWYFSDIKEELKVFTNILENWDEGSAYAYWAWW